MYPQYPLGKETSEASNCPRSACEVSFQLLVLDDIICDNWDLMRRFLITILVPGCSQSGSAVLLYMMEGARGNLAAGVIRT